MADAPADDDPVTAFPAITAQSVTRARHTPNTKEPILIPDQQLLDRFQEQLLSKGEIHGGDPFVERRHRPLVNNWRWGRIPLSGTQAGRSLAGPYTALVHGGLQRAFAVSCPRLTAPAWMMHLHKACWKRYRPRQYFCRSRHSNRHWIVNADKPQG